MNPEKLTPRYHFTKLRVMGLAALRFIGEKVDDALEIDFDYLEEARDE
jgi:hypothetical protein